MTPSSEQDELFDELIKYFSQNFDIGSSRWTYSTKSAHSICEQLLRLKRTRLSSLSVPEGWQLVPWISVKDRLPIVPSDMKDANYKTVDTIVTDGHKSFFCAFAAGNTVGFWSSWAVEGVTHWMPLPSPPTAQEPKS